MNDGHSRRELYKYLKERKLPYFMQMDFDNLTKGMKSNELNEEYDHKYIMRVINYYENKEDYEKCSKLRDVLINYLKS
jgi:hypothetical protein